MSSDTDSEREKEREERAAARAREKVEQAEERAQEHARRAEEQIVRAQQRVAEAEGRVEEKVEQALGRARRAGGGEAEQDFQPLVWLRPEPASRRPSHSRADIARAALDIADEEGFEAVSMRRVAQRLGAGTMTLYHYVRNKDELLTLMSDGVMAEILVPEGELSDHWREAVVQIATRTHDVFARHKWIFERLGDGRIGPSGMHHFEQSLQAVAPLGLDRGQTFEVIGQVDDYVFGFAMREQQEREEHQRGWPPEVVEFFKSEVATGAYPRIEEFFGDDPDAGFDQIAKLLSEPRRFDRGLNRLLDGIEAEFAPN